MSHRIIHLTALSGYKVAINPSRIMGVQENSPAGGTARTLILVGNTDCGDIMVSEPYDQVLRLWADALGNSDSPQ